MSETKEFKCLDCGQKQSTSYKHEKPEDRPKPRCIRCGGDKLEEVPQEPEEAES